MLKYGCSQFFSHSLLLLFSLLMSSYEIPLMIAQQSKLQTIGENLSFSFAKVINVTSHLRK